MADGWHGDADRHHGCAGRGLHPVVLYWRLDLELADMTQEDMIRMAREAGFAERDAMFRVAFVANKNNLERFAALVAAAEREACAKVCDDFEVDAHDNNDLIYRECATAIRARGQA
jgi:hypothetical protein